eukprot:3066813-Amphidinium_carterae.1
MQRTCPWVEVPFEVYTVHVDSLDLCVTYVLRACAFSLASSPSCQFHMSNRYVFSVKFGLQCNPVVCVLKIKTRNTPETANPGI